MTGARIGHWPCASCGQPALELPPVTISRRKLIASPDGMEVAMHCAACGRGGMVNIAADGDTGNFTMKVLSWALPENSS